MALIRRTRLRSFVRGGGCLLLGISFGQTAHAADLNVDPAHHFSERVAKTPAGSIDWKEVFAKVFAANIAADLNIRGQSSMIPETIHRSIYYTKRSRTDLLQAVREAGSASSNGAYEAMKKELEVVPGNDQASLLAQGDIIQSGSGTDKLVAALAQSRGGNVAGIRTDEDGRYNFFDTPAGKIINDVMENYVLVIVPGYASHTQAMYSFIDIVEDANEHYGRASSRTPGFPYAWQRPRVEVTGAAGLKENKFMPAEEFHNSAKAAKIGFDVVEPMGMEMGDSLGRNEPMAPELGKWLEQLLKNPKYTGKKLILLGYSKGGPIIHAVTKWAKENSPQVFDAIQYLVTSNAVLQGAIPATNGFKNLRDVLNRLDPSHPIRTDDETIQKVAGLVKKSDGPGSLNLATVMSKFGGLGAVSPDNPVIARQLNRMGIDAKAFMNNLVTLLDTNQAERLLGGIQSMTAFDMLSWMTKNLNDENFGGKTIFNLSGITDVKDFLLPIGNSQHPDGFDEFGPINPPSIAPQISRNGSGMFVDWIRFSLDNLFLHLTSIAGFEESPGGLYDAQVGWMDTKSIALDRRPINDSLDSDEMARMGVPANNTDRSKLVLGRLGGTSVIDFGNLRATHWDIAFRQAFIPPNNLTMATKGRYYVHPYPRRAYHASIIETIAMYHLMSSGQAHAQ